MLSKKDIEALQQNIEDSHFYQRHIDEILQNLEDKLVDDIAKECEIDYNFIETTEGIVQESLSKLYRIGYFSDKKMDYIVAKAQMKIAEIRYFCSKIEFFRANNALNHKNID